MAVLEGSGKEMMMKTRERDTKGIVFSMFVYVSSKECAFIYSTEAWILHLTN
jgi:hypothetical protein